MTIDNLPAVDHRCRIRLWDNTKPTPTCFADHRIPPSADIPTEAVKLMAGRAEALLTVDYGRPRHRWSGRITITDGHPEVFNEIEFLRHLLTWPNIALHQENPPVMAVGKRAVDIFRGHTCQLCHRPYSQCLQDKCDGRAIAETILEHRREQQGDPL